MRAGSLAGSLAALALAGGAEASSSTGVRGVDCSSSGCIFARDDTNEVCFYDLESGTTTALGAGAFDAPRDVAMARDGSFAVAADAGAGRLTKVDLSDGSATHFGCLGRDDWWAVDGDAIPVPLTRTLFSYSYDDRRLGGASYSYDFAFVEGGAGDDGDCATAAPEGVALLAGGAAAVAALAGGQLAYVDLARGRHRRLLTDAAAGSLATAAVRGLAAAGTAERPWVVGAAAEARAGQSALYAADPTTGRFARAVALAAGGADWAGVEVAANAGEKTTFVVADRAAQGLYVVETAADYGGAQPATFTVAFLAGSRTGATGNADGAGDAARFGDVAGVGAFDGVSVAVADRGNRALRRVWFAGARRGDVATLATLDRAGCGGGGDATGGGLVADALAADVEAVAATAATASKAADRAFDTADLVAPLGLLAGFAGVMALVAAFNARRRKRGYRNIPSYHYRF